MVGITAGTGINNINSNINECNYFTFMYIAELEVEFGYCTEEESIF